MQRLTVTTPAPSQDLVTLDAVKAELPAAGRATDSKLQELISQASRALATHCNRVFGREALSEVLRAPRDDGPAYLARRPVAAVTSVLLDGALLAPDEWEVDGMTGRLWRLRGDAWTPWRGSRLVVVYTAGWLLPGAPGYAQAGVLDVLPADIARACLTLVTTWHASLGRDGLLRSQSFDQVGGRSWLDPRDGSGNLPPQVADGLQFYRRPAIA